MDSIIQERYEQKERPNGFFFLFFTAEGEVVASDDAGLDDGVLLAREGPVANAELGEDNGVELDEEEAEEPRGDVERGDDAGGEAELERDDREDNAEEDADDDPSHSDLRPPRRDLRRSESFLDRELGLLLAIFSFHGFLANGGGLVGGSMHILCVRTIHF